MSKVPVTSTEKAGSTEEQPVALAVGFSARALVQALSDSGFRVVAVDAFGDYDTHKNSLLTIRLPDWASPEAELSIQPHLWSNSREIGKDFSVVDEVPVFLGGGCENWTCLLEHLARLPGLKILGPSAEQLHAIRSLELWRNAAEFAGMNFPESYPRSRREVVGASSLGCCCSKNEHQVLGSWLQKSLRSAGGIGVKRLCSRPEQHGGATELTGQSTGPNDERSDRYVQREIQGRVLGATCVVETSHCDYLGATESWQSEDWYGPSEFIYRGSWGPVPLTALQQRQICQAADYLAWKTGVKGLLQFDLIEDRQGELWFLEVNPRWSAGMEILKRSGLSDPIAAHRRAFSSVSEPASRECERQPKEVSQPEGHTTPAQPGGHTTSKSPLDGLTPSGKRVGEAFSRAQYYVGKAIVYCSSEFLLDRDTILRLQELDNRHFADIPSMEMEDRAVPAGHPVVTVLSSTYIDQSQEEARVRLLNELKGLQTLALQTNRDKPK